MRKGLFFPNDFKWGVSTAAYQIEGAWNEDGKSESIWDVYCRKEGAILDGSNGNVACDHYHRFKEDIDLMASMNIKSYRLSISWCRIIPTGIGEINKKGLKFYDDVINYCLSKNIEPMITLYHWDLPQILEEMGGVCADEFPQWFKEYALVVINYFKDRVKYFATINQPFSIYRAYSEDKRAPARGIPKLGMIATSNLLYAHGLIVKKVKEEKMDIDIGIVINLVYIIPLTNNEKDVKAARMREAITNEMFYMPILKGCFPKEVVDYADSLGIDKKYFHSNDRMKIMSCPVDFLGVNYYQRGLTTFDPENKMLFLPITKADAGEFTETGREIYPDGLQYVLEIIDKISPGMPIYITENGADIRKNLLLDDERINYISKHLLVLNTACKKGINVKGYYIWTLIDNFEWENGYTSKYGMVAINKNLERIPKKSAFWYSEVIKSNGELILDKGGKWEIPV